MGNVSVTRKGNEMNIIEAVKSGKRFRRKGQPRYLELFHDIDLCLSVVDIAADDWEVEEKKVTITESDFNAALVRTTNSFSIYDGPNTCEYLRQLKKELGL
jgi:hypothetical protein